MTHVIMLDSYQRRTDDAHYIVHCPGSLAECRAQTKVPSESETWVKASYAPPRYVEPHPLGAETGAIYEMKPRTRLSLTTGALLAAGAFASGAALAVALHEPVRRWSERRR